MLYYDCPIKAAYMVKEFGVILSDYKDIVRYMDTVDEDYRFTIAPCCYDIFKQKVGDTIGVDGGKLRTSLITEEVIPGLPKAKIIYRDGKQFFTPKTLDENDKVYLLIKKGIYIQGILGVYNTRYEAKTAFKIFYDEFEPDVGNHDFDGHHDYYIEERIKGDLRKSGEDVICEQLSYEPIKSRELGEAKSTSPRNFERLKDKSL